MKYISTRGNFPKVDSAQAIQLGMVPEGGLFVPEKIPVFSEKEIKNMKEQTYAETAFMILKRFLTDFKDQALEQMIDNTYNKDNFNHEKITPLVQLDQETYILELWHGPTAAFKDMALQLMPKLLKKALEIQEIEEDIVILVATSGDTGTAALEGFKNIEGIKIIVFYPEEGVSTIQERQMTTVSGNNVEVAAVKGNFDDCQNAVKEIFGDEDFKNILEKNNFKFSSANSINWGRLVPQIVYYFISYAELLSSKKISFGDKINLCVPTGNFGDILAGYYAFTMGLPVNKFICASNENKVLTDFLKTGVYDINREFKKTSSPSMDILISSNLERFLFEMNSKDETKINKWYEELQQQGKFEIDPQTKMKINNIFTGEYADEKETRSAIKNIFEKYNYLIDPHTAVGVKAFEKYQRKTEENIPTIINSTASPFKFGQTVLKSLEGRLDTENEFEILEKLKEKSNQEIHRGLKKLEQKEIKNKKTLEKSEVKAEIKAILNLK